MNLNNRKMITTIFNLSSMVTNSTINTNQTKMISYLINYFYYLTFPCSNEHYLLQDGRTLVAKLKSGTNCNSRKRNTPYSTPTENAKFEGEATYEGETTQCQRNY